MLPCLDQRLSYASLRTTKLVYASLRRDELVYATLCARVLRFNLQSMRASVLKKPLLGKESVWPYCCTSIRSVNTINIYFSNPYSFLKNDN